MPKKYNYTKKTGRPSKLKTIDMAKLKKLVLLGLTDTQLSAALDISEASLNNYKNSKEFLESIKDCKEICDGQVVHSLFKRACGYKITEQKITKDGDVIDCERDIPPDTIACIYWLNNRQPDKWKNKVEHSGNEENPIRIIIEDAK